MIKDDTVLVCKKMSARQRINAFSVHSRHLAKLFKAGVEYRLNIKSSRNLSAPNLRNVK